MRKAGEIVSKQNSEKQDEENKQDFCFLKGTQISHIPVQKKGQRETWTSISILRKLPRD